MTFVIVMGFHQIIVVMNDVKRHTYIHTYIHSQLKKVENKTVNYMGIPLKRSEKVKYLRVIFDQKMQREDHIKYVNQNILFKYSKIKAIASSLTPYTKKLLINALVMRI